jgi:hypothetical protein
MFTTSYIRSNRWSPLIALVTLLNFLVVGCGQPSNPTVPLPATTASWNPPPVSAACSADVDQDGACDDVDPVVGDSDADDDGSLDGMDVTPQGGGSGGSGNWYSPLLWGAAGIVTGSLVYNFFTSNDCQSDGIAIRCIEPNFSTSTLDFRPVSAGAN